MWCKSVSNSAHTSYTRCCHIYYIGSMYAFEINRALVLICHNIHSHSRLLSQGRKSGGKAMHEYAVSPTRCQYHIAKPVRCTTLGHHLMRHSIWTNIIILLSKRFYNFLYMLNYINMLHSLLSRKCNIIFIKLNVLTI